MFGGKPLDPGNTTSPSTPLPSPPAPAPIAAPAPVATTPSPVPAVPAAPAQGFVIPDTAYVLPTPDVEALAKDYWAGYRLGMASRSIVPSPAGLKPDEHGNGWQPYRDARILPLYRSEAAAGYPLPTNDGYNDAIECGAIYRYDNDTTSAKFVVS